MPFLHVFCDVLRSLMSPRARASATTCLSFKSFYGPVTATSSVTQRERLSLVLQYAGNYKLLMGRSLNSKSYVTFTAPFLPIPLLLSPHPSFLAPQHKVVVRGLSEVRVTSVAEMQKLLDQGQNNYIHLCMS